MVKQHHAPSDAWTLRNPPGSLQGRGGTEDLLGGRGRGALAEHIWRAEFHTSLSSSGWKCITWCRCSGAGPVQRPPKLFCFLFFGLFISTFFRPIINFTAFFSLPRSRTNVDLGIFLCSFRDNRPSVAMIGNISTESERSLFLFQL